MQKTLHDKWLELDASPQRRAAVLRATDHAEMTIPRLFRGYEYSLTHTGEDFPELYSNTMASLITMRSGKLTDAVFPPNGTPFFQYGLNFDALNDAEIDTPEGITTREEAISYMRDVFVRTENMLHSNLQSSNFRDSLNIAFSHAQVTGDPILYMDDDYNFRVYHLGQIIIRRDMHGIVSEMMLNMAVQTDLLPEDMKNMGDGRAKYQNGDYEPYYRHMYRKDGKWYVDSEFRDQKHGDTAEYKTFPYFHIGWNNVSGEDYSRTPVEDNFGAITSLEMCHKALAEGAAGSSEWRMRLDPHAYSKPSDVVDTENGAIVLARQGEMEPITVDLRAPLQAIAAYIEQLEARLEKGWGISAAATLRGDRVTATQIQEATREVAEADGAILTHVAQSLQKSLVERMVEIEIRKGSLDPVFVQFWEAGAVDVNVKTGLDALGRQIQAARLQSILQTAYSTQSEEFIETLDMEEIARESVRVTGLDVTQFTRSAEQKQQRAEARQQQLLQQQATQQGIQSTGKIAEKQLTEG